MSDILPYSTQWLDESDIEAVTEVMRGSWLTTGPTIAAFEEAFADFCGARYAVAVANGTAALHLVALAIGLGPGDVHITTPITFLATANCARYCDAEVDFADVDSTTITLDPEAVRQRAAGHTGKVRSIAPVDLAGTPADWPAFRALADDLGAFLLQDACHAVGATYEATPGGERAKVGSCAHADACVFSMHPVKHFTTGEGGLVTTNDEGLADALRSLRSHGIVRDPARMQRNDGPWYYEMPALGFNYRLTDLQAALGLSQLRRLPEWVSRRQAIALRYDEAFADHTGLVTPGRVPGREGSYHLYPIQLRAPGMRAKVFDDLRERGLGVQVHYVPVHLQPYYRDRYGFTEGDFPNAEAYYQSTISIPLYPRMSDEDVERVIGVVRACVPEG